MQGHSPRPYLARAAPAVRRERAALHILSYRRPLRRSLRRRDLSRAGCASASSRASRGPLSLYVHVPFCESICYYCACNKVITKDHGRSAQATSLRDQRRWPWSASCWTARGSGADALGRRHAQFPRRDEMTALVDVDPRALSAGSARRVLDRDRSAQAGAGDHRVCWASSDSTASASACRTSIRRCSGGQSHPERGADAGRDRAARGAPGSVRSTST